MNILVLGSGHTSNDNLSITSQVSPVGVNRLAEGIRIYKELENAKLIEDGTHQELLNLHGKYFELFNMQAQFYQ